MSFWFTQSPKECLLSTELFKYKLVKVNIKIRKIKILNQCIFRRSEFYLNILSIRSRCYDFVLDRNRSFLVTLIQVLLASGCIGGPSLFFSVGECKTKQLENLITLGSWNLCIVFIMKKLICNSASLQ